MLTGINSAFGTILITFLIILFSLAWPLHSQENADVITSIEVIGLKRTKVHIAEYPLERFLGMERSAFDVNDVYAVVMDTGILELVSAELIEGADGLILRVTVEEKWAIFPFPLIVADSGETIFGLFFLDTNAFGLRDMAVLGGAYGSFGWTVVAMYNHTRNRDGLPGWNSIFMYGRQETEAVDRYEKIHRKYAVDHLNFSLGLNYLFVDIFTGSFAISFSDQSLTDTDDILNPPDAGARLLIFNPGFSLRQSSWDGYFLSQQSISLGYNYNYAISGSSFHQVEFRAIYEYSLVPGFRLSLRSGGVWKSTSDPLFEEGPQKAQVTILPRNFSAQHYAGFSLGLEKHLYRAPWGTLSALGSWQGVFSSGSISDFEFDHGPSGGLLFYLTRIALPAMGGSVSYNMNSSLFRFSFNIGMSF